MPARGLRTQNFAARCDFEPFPDGFLCFATRNGLRHKPRKIGRVPGLTTGFRLFRWGESLSSGGNRGKVRRLCSRLRPAVAELRRAKGRSDYNKNPRVRFCCWNILAKWE